MPAPSAISRVWFSSDNISFTQLAPDRRIAAVPYALQAEEAKNAWSLSGNTGTLPGTHFLGTTDNQALQLHVNGIRALRLEPNTTSPNVIAGYSGNSVTTSAAGATVGGGGGNGNANRVTDDFGVVGGGIGNIAGDNAGTPSDQSYATVGGGFRNTASGAGATVSGGYSNTASGAGATVSGGSRNTASGNYSHAAGYEAMATNLGSFVWADATYADFNSTADNQFSVRATGGVRLETGAATVRVNGNTVWHAGNDGSGSGLDADLLDGLHAGNASGSIPLNNSTLNTNLNADLLDGLHASAIQPHYQGVKVVAKSGGDYTTVSAALASITDAGDTNRYLVKVMPGVYSEQVTMKPYVDIEGSGELTTKISYTGSGSPNTGTVLGASNAELRFLSVENTGGAGCAIAIYNNGASVRLTHVTASASGGSVTNRTVLNNTGSPVMTNVTISASGGAGGSNSGVENQYASPVMTNVTVSASGNTGYNTGVFNYHSSATIQNSVISAGGASGTNRGIDNSASSGAYTVLVTNSQVSGTATSILTNSYFTVRGRGLAVERRRGERRHGDVRRGV